MLREWFHRLPFRLPEPTWHAIHHFRFILHHPPFREQKYLPLRVKPRTVGYLNSKVINFHSVETGESGSNSEKKIVPFIPLFRERLH